VVVLAGRLVDAVDVRGPDQVRLVDRQPIGPAINLPRARVDYLRLGIAQPAGLENRQLTSTVDLQVGVRGPHAVDVAHLAARLKITSRSRTSACIVEASRTSAMFNAHARFDARDVEQVAAVVLHQRIDQQHVGVEVDQRPGRGWTR